MQMFEIFFASPGTFSQNLPGLTRLCTNLTKTKTVSNHNAMNTKHLKATIR